MPPPDQASAASDRSSGAIPAGRALTTASGHARRGRPMLDDAPGRAREARAEGAEDMNTVFVALSADHLPLEATRS